MTTATVVSVGDTSVTVTSTSPPITDWAARYFAPWWSTCRAKESVRGAHGTARHHVRAEVDHARWKDIEREVRSSPATEVAYASGPILHHRDNTGTVIAFQAGPGLAYRYAPASGELLVVGTDEQQVAVAAARLAREVVRGRLLDDGWSILHASAVVRDGRAVLALGDKGAGKSTTALLLGRAGYQLLANDRVFIRLEPDGALRLLPWPAAAAIGLGLLSALGAYDAVRNRVLAGEALHPTQHPRVTKALRTSSTQPLWNGSKELKAQFFPDQLTWLGLTLTTHARAAGLLFPAIDQTLSPTTRPAEQALRDADFLTSTSDDRYPDVFRLADNRLQASPPVEALSRLPSRSVVLNHDTAVSARELLTAADQLLTHEAGVLAARPCPGADGQEDPQ
jgi:hypothetical protein